MKRKDFPGSRENVGRLVEKYGAIGKPTTAERRILEQYLAGCVSSNTHSRDVLFNMVQIRHLLGYGLPHELIHKEPVPKSDVEVTRIKSRLMDIARLLFRADMKDPSNIALRDEATRLLDELPRQESEEAYTDAC